MFTKLIFLLACVGFLGACSKSQEFVRLKNWQQARLTALHESPSHWEAITITGTSGREPGKRYIIQKTVLPDIKIEDPAIYFFRVYNSFVITLDDKPIFKYGNLEATGKQDFYGFRWHIVRLPDHFQGKVLKVIANSSHSRIGIRRSPELGSHQLMLKNIVQKYTSTLLSVGLHLAFFVMGLVVCVNRVINYGVVFLSVYALFSGFFIFSISPIAPLVHDDPVLWAKIEMLSMWLLPITGFSGIQAVLENRRSIVISAAIGSQIMHITYALLSWTLGFRQYWEHGFSFNVINLINLVAISIVIVYHAIRGDRLYRYLFRGLLIICLGAILESLMAMRVIDIEFSTFTYTNLIMITLVVSVSIRRYLQISQDLLNTRVQKDLAEIKAIKTKEQAISKLVGGVAHEFNNPLAIIRGCAELTPKILKRDDATELLQKNYQRMLGAVARITTINRQLIDLTQKQSRMGPYRNLPIRELVDEVKRDFADQNLEIDCRVADDQEIRINLEKVQRALQALIKNAFDALDRRSDREGRRVTVIMDEQKETLLVDVVDYGDGIADQIFDVMFDPFSTTKDIGGGMGLDLFFAKQLIQSCKGTIEILQRKDPTIFRVSIPLSTQFVAQEAS
ncbi:sensor histidine kinase [Pseudobacteriovorax antillogorgiicola]|uniref:histidine kinase n=1 Tax=Pseudobacteriovorax antillogorgiicola TaxID=1513793 RepID=A0A1Y6BPS1_9BACT|nr:sensor histidine kinase [Pseudobacteriovorax antillogorgiicola]TCS54497.1 signal transduction histidine kinase [Pseudobacteriovorax antillogorgiicola]SMF19047.1 Signal transduction histidine kinase [Pseudobacteriovorax antillogorgiicola]